ncbi:hypothetical protein Tco_1138648 [Tanacetum coccineum]
MASFDYRLNPLYAIKECSSCGALYTSDYCCSKGGLEDKILVPKTPDSSQRPPQDCVKCGNPVEGPNCQGCALWRKKLKEVWFTICHENGIYQDLLNTYESSDDDTNVVNAPREPFVVKQDPGENSSQSPPQINHNCCYECGDSLDGIFCQRCTCKSCGKGAHIGYNCPPKAPIISNPEPCNQTIDELPQTLPSFDPTCYSEKENSLPYISKPNFVDDSPNIFNPPPQPPMYSCEFCGNDARYGHYCTPQVPFIYPEPCYNQDFNFLQDFHDFQQQYLCCENCGGPHETFQCQPMNEDYYHEQNSCYDSNSFGFDQFQPPQYTVNHPIFNAQNELFNSQNKLMEQLTSMCDMVGQYIQKKEEEKRIEEEQAAKARYWKILVCYDDDDDEESSIPLKDIIISGLPPCVAITPDSPKMDSLIMVDKHLDTIPETKSDEFIKSSVENLVQNPSESEDECEYDVPNCDDSQTTNFSTYSNPLFDDSTSSDDELSHEEEIHKMSFITYSNPLFDLDEEINSGEFNLIHNEDPDSTLKNDRFNIESYLLESLLNQIEDSNPEGDIRLVERLLYDSSTPRPPEAFQANSDMIIESFPTFTIPVKDSDSLREEIDIFPGPDDSIRPGIESDDFDSENDDNSTSLPEFKSFHVDYPDSRDSTIDVVEYIFVDVPNILPTYPTLHMDFDFIPSHNDLGSDLDVSSPSGDRNKIYDPGICIEVESMRFLATHSSIARIVMAPVLAVFVLRSQELQILSFIWEIQYPNLI